MSGPSLYITRLYGGLGLPLHDHLCLHVSSRTRSWSSRMSLLIGLLGLRHVKLSNPRSISSVTSSARCWLQSVKVSQRCQA